MACSLAPGTGKEWERREDADSAVMAGRPARAPSAGVLLLRGQGLGHAPQARVAEARHKEVQRGDLRGPTSRRYHSACEGHHNKVFETRLDVRDAGDELTARIHEALAELNLVGNDPKDSARAASSSSSPPTPSAAEESLPSTSTPIQDVVPGI